MRSIVHLPHSPQPSTLVASKPLTTVDLKILEVEARQTGHCISVYWQRQASLKWHAEGVASRKPPSVGTAE